MPDSNLNNNAPPSPPPAPADPGNTPSRAHKSATPAKPKSEAKRKRKPRRIIFRSLAITAAALPILAIIAFRLIANAPILERLLREQAMERLGCDFHTTGVHIDWFGRLVIEEPRLTIPDIKGKAGEVLTAPRAIVHIDWSSMFTSAPRPTLVRIDDAVLRVSQETNSGIINLAHVGPPDAKEPFPSETRRPPTPPTTPDAKPTRSIIPPRIDLRSATLELGEHNDDDAGSYTPLAALTVRGLLAPEPDAPERFTIKLQRVPDSLSEFASRESTDAPGDPLAYLADHRLTILAGELDVVASTARLELLNVDLADWGPEQTPSSVRELWAQLDVKGSIPRTEFRYTPTAGVIVTVTLVNVTMNTPVQADTTAEAGTQQTLDYLSLRNVSGTLAFSREGLDARLQGLVEDLPCQVNLQTTGLSVNAPLRCEIISERFVVGDEPELMPYVPNLVRRRFADFSGPTATVDARVLLTRGEPVGDQPAELTTEGTIRVENGRAAFENFPYPGIELSGLVRFTDESIDILNVQGRGLRGGIISGQATIAPLTTASRVNVQVLALDIPVDDILRDAIPRGRGRILDQLLSQSQYNKLLELGLVQPSANFSSTSDTAHPTDAPPFNFGGVISQLEIIVKREPINDGEWSWSANVDLPRLGLVPEGFPLPIEATDVRLELGDTYARLIGGNFRGAGGGIAQVDVDVTLGGESANNAFDATITVVSNDMPIDARLIHALPDTERVTRKPQPDTDPNHPGQNEDAARLSIHRLLTQLRPQGTMGVHATVRLHDEPGHDSVLFDVTADLKDVTARPTGPSQDAGLNIDNITGRVYANNNQLRINNLRGVLQRETDHVADLTLEAVLQSSSIEPNQQNEAKQHQQDQATRINLLATNLRIEAPFEHLLAIFSARAASAVTSIRERHHIAGLVNADVRAHSAVTAQQHGTSSTSFNDEDDIAVDLELSDLRDIRLRAYNTDLILPKSQGTVRVQHSPADPGPILEFVNFATAIHPGSEPSVGLALHGRLQLDSTESTVSANAGHLTANLTNARFESTMLARVLTSLTPGRTSHRLLALQPKGRFDADIHADIGPISTPDTPLEPHPQTRTKQAANPAVTLRLRPAELAFTLDEQQHRFDRVQGQLVAEINSAGAIGHLEALRLEQPALRVTIDGPFQYNNDTGFELRSTLTLNADRYDNTTTALLPEPVREALESIGLKSNSPWAIRDAWVGYAGQPTADSQPTDDAAALPSPGVAFVGLVAFEHLTADIGLPIYARNATAHVDARRSQNAKSLNLAIDLAADRLTVAGVPMTAGKARIVSANAPGSIAIPQASADCEGGRVSMNALLRNDTSTNPGAWTLNVQIAGARLVPVLESIRASGAGKNNLIASLQPKAEAHETTPTSASHAEPPPQQQQQQQWQSTADDRRRGYLDATLSLAGNIGRPQERTGRGTIRVSGGDVVSLPIIINLVELTSLQFPVGDKLDYLDTSFHVIGNTWSFDQISLVSDTMSILGSGTMTTPDNNLDLRFAARSRLRLPVITDLVEGVRDELATVTVTGPIDDPRFRVEQLSATRMFLESIIGQPPRENAGSPTPTPGPDADRESRSERDRLRGRR